MPVSGKRIAGLGLLSWQFNAVWNSPGVAALVVDVSRRVDKQQNVRRSGKTRKASAGATTATTATTMDPAIELKKERICAKLDDKMVGGRRRASWSYTYYYGDKIYDPNSVDTVAECKNELDDTGGIVFSFGEEAKLPPDSGHSSSNTGYYYQDGNSLSDQETKCRVASRAHGDRNQIKQKNPGTWEDWKNLAPTTVTGHTAYRKCVSALDPNSPVDYYMLNEVETQDTYDPALCVYAEDIFLTDAEKTQSHCPPTTTTTTTTTFNVVPYLKDQKICGKKENAMIGGRRRNDNGVYGSDGTCYQYGAPIVYGDATYETVTDPLTCLQKLDEKGTGIVFSFGGDKKTPGSPSMTGSNHATATQCRIANVANYPTQGTYADCDQEDWLDTADRAVDKHVAYRKCVSSQDPTSVVDFYMSGNAQVEDTYDPTLCVYAEDIFLTAAEKTQNHCPTTTTTSTTTTTEPVDVKCDGIGNEMVHFNNTLSNV